MCASTALKYAGAWCQWNHHKMLMIIINKQGKHTTVLYARSRQILFSLWVVYFLLFFFSLSVPYFFLCSFFFCFFVDNSLFLFWFLFYLSSFFRLYCVWIFSHGILTFFDCTAKVLTEAHQKKSNKERKTAKSNPIKKTITTNKATMRTMEFCSVVNGVGYCK